MNQQALQRALNRARWWALSDQPFYGQLVCGLTDSFASVGTACTDGVTIKWDPTFLGSLSDAEIRAVLVHEALHCGHGHLWRLPIDETANLACDYVVNDIVAAITETKIVDGKSVTIHPCKLPNGAALCPPKYRGKTEEWIYQDLASRKPSKGRSGSTAGGPGIGDFEAPADAQKPSPGNEKASGWQTLRDQWAERVMQAAQAAQAAGRGDVPADMARELARLKAQRLDWRQELADFVRDVVARRNDWSRSNRRHAAAPVIYPRKRRDDLATVVFARDTSGSISDQQAAEFSAVIGAVMADVGCSGIVVDCDAHVQAIYHLEAGAECPLTAKGGGGTDFRPVFALAHELQEGGRVIGGVVYLTDLDGRFGEPSDLPTLWISEGGRKAPWGRVVAL